MRGNFVYLAGPITGCSYEGCTDWRDFAAQRLEEVGAHCLSPMRGKEYLKSESRIFDKYDNHVMSCSRGITTRDRFDCVTSDVVLVNLRGAAGVSIGTVMEIAWAFLTGVPVVCVMEKGNVHEHSMISESIGFRVDTLEEGISVVRAILDLR
jgi:nucleoside 2-deoxyribosyltransferase